MSEAITRMRLKLARATLEVDVCGEGRAIFMIPSLGRGASDFHGLMQALAPHGYRCVAVNLRGIAGSTGPLAGVDDHDFAADVGEAIAALDAAPAHLIGHAYGNCVARCLAADRPGLIGGVVLLAAGGVVPPEPAAMAALHRAVTQPLDDAAWCEAMQVSGFFATGSDPMVWRSGWWPETGEAQLAARNATPLDDWWRAGEAPLLVIQGLQDRIGVPENGWRLREALGERVRLVDLPDVGHALLPEAPQAIARAVLSFFSDIH